MRLELSPGPRFFPGRDKEATEKVPDQRGGRTRSLRSVAREARALGSRAGVVEGRGQGSGRGWGAQGTGEPGGGRWREVRALSGMAGWPGWPGGLGA